MPPQTPLRVALIGYGLGGSVFHAPLISVTPRLSLDAIVTSDPERQSLARQRFPHARVGPTVEDLLRRADEFDLAVVTVPNAAHVAVAEAALRAGLSAVVDKPVAPTVEEAGRLGRLAGELRRRVIPYHNRRWDGDFRTLKALVESGRLGRLWRLESRFERWKPTPAQTQSWKQDPNQPAGGVLYDLGTHLIDQAIHLFGRPTTVYAELAGRTGPLDDDTFVALTYPDGLVVHLWASTTAAQLGPRFRALGSSRGYTKFGLDVQEDALRAGRLPTEPGWGQEPPEAWGQLGTLDDVETIVTQPGGYHEFYAGVAACFLDGVEPPVALDDAVAGLEVIEAARRSADSASVAPLDK
jgi:predicted dehydrogenase